MTGLDKIKERILADAKEDARRILETAQADCRQMAEKYAAEADETRERIAARAEREGERVIASARSDAAMARRNILLHTRAALVDEAFERAREQLLDNSGNKYRELLTALLVGALADIAASEDASAALGDEVPECAAYEALFNAEDRTRHGAAVVDAARRTATRRVGAARAAKLCLSADTAPIDGGVVLRCGDVETNCSLSMLLAQLRTELEPKVEAVLFPQGERDE